MNDILKQLCVEAECPDDVLNTMWFSIFIQKFSHLLVEMIESECK